MLDVSPLIIDDGFLLNNKRKKKKESICIISLKVRFSSCIIRKIIQQTNSLLGTKLNMKEIIKMNSVW